MTSSSVSTAPPDTQTIRCPRLGHQIAFSYCRSENQGAPCFKALDCWYTQFDVHTFFNERLTPEQFQSSFQAQAPPKVHSLLDLIEKARTGRSGDPV